MATVPLSGTNVRLLSGVPFSNDYKHTRWFESASEQTSYFLGRVTTHVESQFTFQRKDGMTFVAVGRSIDELWGTNYLMFQNASYNSKWFYAFVTKLEYISVNRTNVHFEIDVLQTWRFEMNFKPSIVVREHCKLWNVDGTPVVNTVDEGLNYGTDYDVVDARNIVPQNGLYFLVIVSKSTLHVPTGHSQANLIKSSLNGSPQPLCYYIHPFWLDGTSPNYWDGVSMRNGAPITDELGVIVGYEQEPDVKDISDVTQVLSTIFSQDNAVNNIVSMYITEHIGYNVEYDFMGNAVILPQPEFQLIGVNDGSFTNWTVYVNRLQSYETTTVDCGDKYFRFKSVEESKLLMYPYAITILDDFKGNRVVLKNEYIDNNKLFVDVMGSLGTSNKVAYVPRDYNTGDLIDFDERTRMAQETALINNNPQDVSILSDMLSAYLQGNRNSLQNQRTTLAFNGMMDAANAGVSGIGSALRGNAVGLLTAGGSMVQGAGNTALALEGLNAKLRDINNVPPQLAKMGSNTAFDFGHELTGFYIIKKQIKEEYRKKLTDFFKMFGYKVNELKMPNFHTRQSWNYVQTESCVIVGNFNNEDLQQIKNIFDGGITLWHNNDVGNYSLANGVI